MSERVQRDFRRQASKVAHATVGALSEPINAALENERLTRQRVEKLESGERLALPRIEHLEMRAHAAQAILSRSFLGRVRWLILGS